MTTPPKESFVFIIGSPRSGTTVLGEMLDVHPLLCQWYEPYFVWDRFFRSAPHDERTPADATDPVKAYIYNRFRRYRRRKKCLVLVDKSPRNSLKIPFIQKIFPQARFVHLLRDGRDATLSIHREWQRRRAIVRDQSRQGRFNYPRAMQVLTAFLARQTLLRDKLDALWFETHGHIIDKKKQLHRLRWNGEIGWGPRFKDWQQVYAESSLLQFNARQWRACVESIRRDWDCIQASHRMTLKYEDLVDRPEENIDRILDFIGVDSSEAFKASLPRMMAGNYQKWKKAFTPDQLAEIHPVLTPLLIELGYTGSEKWINQN
jgi:hypothetical protein